MPIISNNAPVPHPKPIEAISTPEEVSETESSDSELLAQKRAARAQRRTKYQLVRKDKTAKDYKAVTVVVAGEEQEMSDSSKFMIDMLLGDKRD